MLLIQLSVSSLSNSMIFPGEFETGIAFDIAIAPSYLSFEAFSRTFKLSSSKVYVLSSFLII